MTGQGIFSSLHELSRSASVALQEVRRGPSTSQTTLLKQINDMPSLRTVSQTGTAIFGLLRAQTLAGDVKSCPSSTGLSCRNSTAIENTCCTNTPGGLLLQTQFWDSDPATGPSDSWTVHGLWPDNCDGTYQQFCDANREYTNITQILESYNQTSLLTYMNKYWKDYQGEDETFWEHEWNKHGTCISTLDTQCYTNYKPQQELVDFFTKTVSLFKTLPSYTFLKDAGIVPSNSATYKLDDVFAALKKGHGAVPTVQCTDDGALNEIWYYYNTVGTVAEGKFQPAAATTSGDCPDTVKYLPKDEGASPTSTSSMPASTSTTSSTSSPTSTSGPFSGRGYLDVQVSGESQGCLISAGTWYTTGTCATYTASQSGDGFTLKSSKGDCAVSEDDGAFSCGSGVSTATTFESNSSLMTYNGDSDFSADEVAEGSTQQTVYIGSGAVDLKISWRTT